MHLYQIELYSGVSRKQKIKKRLPCKTDLNYSKIQKTEEKEKKMFEKQREGEVMEVMTMAAIKPGVLIYSY